MWPWVAFLNLLGGGLAPDQADSRTNARLVLPLSGERICPALSSETLLISLGGALLAYSLCQREEKHTMQRREVGIGGFQLSRSS